MHLLIALFYYSILIPLSHLPMRVLYWISDILFLIFYYTGYRKQVIKGNIYRSFPEKSDKEKDFIVRTFYKHFSDLIVESLKYFTISKEDALKHMKMENLSTINDFFNEGKNVIIAGGHYNNWELFAITISEFIPFQTVAIYSPLKNKFFDDKMKETRGKYGLKMIPTKQIGHFLNHNKDKAIATIFGFDQSPSNAYNAYWMQFLNQETGILLGVEKYAYKYNMPVYYGQISKVKRGYYTLNLIEVCKDPSKMKEGSITENITHLLENDIRQNPPFWLWSHKRWKRKKPEDYILRSLRS
ncbi:MAG: lysophospholipid acyltransferase family protein [Saprospiraceae bacterium]|jgi:KDO2-lipid IV(A) lauroyltransferase|nr:lysophospholipid acyltransferase family protein [Saprospiraceae bacterium]MCO5278051.1 lysophospholipid acyltransferase family protein [Saprospiraceae bacterium]HMT77946.1 lysophospholipid acyltransferase family protein [Saprospiraceae bacterium]HQU96036.1 lysophospholipid acyltransferase family protein [Saprospiraceae bacterium]